MYRQPIFPKPSFLPRFFDNMTKIEIRVPSTTKPERIYTVTIDTELKIVECECLGFQFTGRCRHIRFLKSLVRDLLHETPGVTAEK